MRRALRVHPLSTYLVFQGVSALVAVACAGALSADGLSWRPWVSSWLLLGLVGLVWTQLVWGSCWAAAGEYGLSGGVRIALMSAAGAAMLLPCLALNVVHDTVWFVYGLVLAPYGLVSGVVGGAVLAVRDRIGFFAPVQRPCEDDALHEFS